MRRDESLKRNGSVKRNGPVTRKGSRRREEVVPQRWQVTAGNACELGSSSSYSTPPEKTNAFSIPPTSIPQRSSSFDHGRKPVRGHARKPSIRAVADSGYVLAETITVPNHGRSQSPVKQAGLRQDPITSDAARKMPSRTRLREPYPYDILEYPSYKHPRVKLELQATAPVFVGGGSVEGFVKLTVDDNERMKQRRSLGIGALSMDLVGYEEVRNSRRAIFLALVTELIDAKHPPPLSMAEPVNLLLRGDRFWALLPSSSSLPFMVSLPLDTGPPPFQSKHASIRFMLCVTALINDAGKHYRVRASQEVQVLPTYDPEKALTSLHSPLTASDELPMPRAGGFESVQITAGLHRQVWVSGSTIFVDVPISNKSNKPVKRLDLSLERDILCYKYPAATTRERSTGHARIFESNHQNMIVLSSTRSGQHGWNGVEPHESETRTSDLELPRGHATVRCGKYFEVRYFLNITASVSNSKLVSIQLPIILIHMNSLDVVPNSVAQVAAAIAEKRAQHHHRRPSSASRNPDACAPLLRQCSTSSPARARALHRKPSYTPGQAFAAPRQQSLDRQRAQKTDIQGLGAALDASPRKHHPNHLHHHQQHHHHHYHQPLPQQPHPMTLRKRASNLSFGNLSLGGKTSSSSNGNESAFRAIAFRTPEHHKKNTPPSPSFRSGGGAESVDSIRARMRRMVSLNSLHAEKSRNPSTARSNGTGGRQENVRPPPTRPAEPPPILGLSSATRRSLDLPPGGGSTAAAGGGPAIIDDVSRPATSLSFRERLDRSRFEFKRPVLRRKASVGASIRERGVNLWEAMRVRGREREREREGWI